jgi:hypothetical protein
LPPGLPPSCVARLVLPVALWLLSPLPALPVLCLLPPRLSLLAAAGLGRGLLSPLPLVWLCVVVFRRLWLVCPVVRCRWWFFPALVLVCRCGPVLFGGRLASFPALVGRLVGGCGLPPRGVPVVLPPPPLFRPVSLGGLVSWIKYVVG